jgi:hypothetical protein
MRAVARKSVSAKPWLRKVRRVDDRPGNPLFDSIPMIERDVCDSHGTWVTLGEPRPFSSLTEFLEAVISPKARSISPSFIEYIVSITRATPSMNRRSVHCTEQPLKTTSIVLWDEPGISVTSRSGASPTSAISWSVPDSASWQIRSV